jgi:hypothetical protein
MHGRVEEEVDRERARGGLAEKQRERRALRLAHPLALEGAERAAGVGERREQPRARRRRERARAERALRAERGLERAELARAARARGAHRLHVDAEDRLRHPAGLGGGVAADRRPEPRQRQQPCLEALVLELEPRAVDGGRRDPPEPRLEIRVLPRGKARGVQPAEQLAQRHGARLRRLDEREAHVDGERHGEARAQRGARRRGGIGRGGGSGRRARGRRRRRRLLRLVGLLRNRRRVEERVRPVEAPLESQPRAQGLGLRVEPLLLADEQL